MKTIGVIGGGVLGKAVARGFMEHGEVKVFDVQKDRATHSMEEAATCDIVFICLPTPARPDGQCDTTAITDFLATARLNEWWMKDSCYVIRSTVPVGFTNSIAAQYLDGTPIFHSPEFLTARCSIVDFQTPSRNIIGYPDGAFDSGTERAIEWKTAFYKLDELYRARFPGAEMLHMPSNGSELVKLACNTFFAMKVTIFNLFNEIADAADVNWGYVERGILSDGRIAHAHTQVPGPDGARGFGGTCLPKDTASLYHCGKTLGVDVDVLGEIIYRNEFTRQKDPRLARVVLPGWPKLSAVSAELITAVDAEKAS